VVAVTAIDSDTCGYAVLDNLGSNGWDLRVRTGQTVHHLTFTNQSLADAESPRQRAETLIAALGWVVQGDGSWFASAWTGPGADTTWALIASLDPTPVVSVDRDGA
jgi:hypothetical protein